MGKFGKGKYSTWTDEEKANYAAYREEYATKREQELESKFNLLREELLKLKDSQTAISILDTIQNRKPAKVGYLTNLFGTETPEVGTKTTYSYIGIRGPNGERMAEIESVKHFVERVGDIVTKYSATDINQMCWYVERRGYKLHNDKTACTVTLKALPTTESEPVAIAKPNSILIKKVG
jgi:hypothetical protein